MSSCVIRFTFVRVHMETIPEITNMPATPPTVNPNFFPTVIQSLSAKLRKYFRRFSKKHLIAPDPGVFTRLPSTAPQRIAESRKLACYTPLVPGTGMASEKVTQLLMQLSGGNRTVVDELTPLVYQELKRVAGSQLRNERPGHTLQATA